MGEMLWDLPGTPRIVEFSIDIVGYPNFTFSGK